MWDMIPRADLHPGTATTDRGDAFIIADTVRTMPHALRVLDRDEERPPALTMLAGFDDAAHGPDQGRQAGCAGS